MDKQDQNKPAPRSPEGYPDAVRKQLDQRDQTHEGADQPAAGVRPGTSAQRGATEHEVTPIKPPMQGPADLVGADDQSDDDQIDPADELTPG